MTTTKPEVLFVCVHNAGRSQMGAALLAHHAGDRVVVRSAGTAPADTINPAVVEAISQQAKRFLHAQVNFYHHDLLQPLADLLDDITPAARRRWLEFWKAQLAQLDATFALEEGGITALFGRSGSGKTSTILAMAGLLTPDAGHIRIGERVLFDSATGMNVPTHRRRLGYVFQEASLFEHLDVQGNLQYGMKRTRSAEAVRTLGAAVELLGIAHL